MNPIEVDGHPVVVHEYGPADCAEPAWLLIHGGGHDPQVWETLATALAASGARVLAPALPAHGGSGGSALPDIDAMAAWVQALIAKLALPSVQLCGHSMGSLIALAVAAAAPERVARLVLVGSSAPMPVSDFLLEAARSDPDRACELINKFSFAPAEQLGAARRRALEDGNLARLRRQGAAVLATDLAACNAWQGGLDAASRVRCPSLILCGEFDRMTPAAAARPLLDALASASGRARLRVLPGCGHTMMEEAPEALFEALRM